MTYKQVSQFSGNGNFDHETDTKEAALVLVLPGTEVIACSILREGALFGKVYVAENSGVDVQTGQASCLVTSAERR